VIELEKRAIQQGLRTLYLLTTTAEAFFADLGYVPVERTEVPAAVADTRQLRELCPGSARVMGKQLTQL
jgi:N-acetylglutamate synthase-like GNAT family acetyltransferase